MPETKAGGVYLADLTARVLSTIWEQRDVRFGLTCRNCYPSSLSLDVLRLSFVPTPAPTRPPFFLHLLFSLCAFILTKMFDPYIQKWLHQ